MTYLTAKAGLARVVPAGEYAVLELRDAGAGLLRFESEPYQGADGARRCRLCHFSIEDAIDPALSAIW
jgi:hypothetical protein